MKQLKQSHQEFIKYGLVGVIGLGIDMGIFYLLTSHYSVSYPFSKTICNLFDFMGIQNTLQTSDILISAFISSTLAIINNFILNSYFTFKVKDKKLKRFISFASIALLGLFVQLGAITVMHNYLNINELISKAIAIFIVAMLQFGLNKYVTFKTKDESNSMAS